MKQKIFGALLALTVSGAAVAEMPKSFTVGTASQGGTYFTYGSGWANLVSSKLGIPGGGEVTGGPTQNLALVHTGELEFGLTTMGPASEALAGKSPLMPGMKMDQVRAIFLCIRLHSLSRPFLHLVSLRSLRSLKARRSVSVQRVQLQTPTSLKC